MCCDDHELSLSLTSLELVYQPGKPFPVKRSTSVTAIPEFVVHLGVIEDNDPDRDIRSRFEAIAGKS
jgi:hypothetical protein